MASLESRLDNSFTVKQLQQIIVDTVPASAGIKSKLPSTAKAKTTHPTFIPRIEECQNDYDEVLPSIYLGDKELATDIPQLNSLGITLIVNAAQGQKFHQVNTAADYYMASGIQYYGVPAMDIFKWPLHKYFRTAADAIDQALISKGRVYVHCVQGLSRSATLVVAYLMLKKGQTAGEALKSVRQKRAVRPNDGFLQQLCDFHAELHFSEQ